MSVRQTYFLIALLLAWFWAIVILAVWVFAKSSTVRYDCGMVEFMPDTPVEVRKQCRMIRT